LTNFIGDLKIRAKMSKCTKNQARRFLGGK